MFINGPTETEKLIKMIEENSPKVTEVLKEIIDGDDTASILQGVHYYFNKSDVKKRQKHFYNEAGQKIQDTEAINNKVPHGWHKLLVDQKVAYLVGQPITITGEDEVLVEKVNLILAEDIDDALPELIKNASNKGREWLHPYIDEDGQFDYIIVPAEEGIPLYDNSKRKNLEGFIRHYALDDDTVKIELWDKEQVTYYEIIDGEVVLDMSVELNPASHFFYGENGYGWGEVPFIEFANNEEKVSDLTFYKELIDNFDETVSGVADNLQEIQSLVYVLKGYEGTSLKDFKQNLRHFKVIKTSDEPGSGVDTIQAEVPIASVDSHLNRLEDSIFTFGQGVNTNTDKFGNSPSGIALKFLFSLLDMKCNVLERKFNKGLTWLFWYVTEYLKITSQVPDTADYKTLKATFNKSMLMNELELVTMAQVSKGIVSDETILSNHPWVDDVAAELERVKQQQSAYPPLKVPNEEPE